MTAIDQGLYTGTRATGGAPVLSDAPKSAFESLANNARKIIEQLLPNEPPALARRLPRYVGR